MQCITPKVWVCCKTCFVSVFCATLTPNIGVTYNFLVWLHIQVCKPNDYLPVCSCKLLNYDKLNFICTPENGSQKSSQDVTYKFLIQGLYQKHIWKHKVLYNSQLYPTQSQQPNNMHRHFSVRARYKIHRFWSTVLKHFAAICTYSISAKLEHGSIGHWELLPLSQNIRSFGRLKWRESE